MAKTTFKIGDYVITTDAHKRGLKSNVIAKVVGISLRGKLLSLSTQGIKQYVEYVCESHPVSMCVKTDMTPKQFFSTKNKHFSSMIATLSTK